MDQISTPGGGVLQFSVVNDLATQTIDKHTLIPWAAYKSIIPKNRKALSVIAAYRVIGSSHGPASASS